MQKFAHITIFILLLFGLGCSSSTSSSVENQEFSIQINLMDENNDPLSEYQVSITNKISNVPHDMWGNFDHALTNIVYQLKEERNVDLKIFDIENNLVANLIDSETKPAGTHTIDWETNSDFNGDLLKGGSLVFKSNLKIFDPVTDELIIDTTGFMCRYRYFDATGNTDSSGVYYTSNKKFVPCLYDTPDQEITDENGNLLDHFTFIDSVIVKIYNPEMDTYNYFVKQVKDGINVYNLAWSDSLAFSDEWSSRTHPNSKERDNEDDDVPHFKHLKGNYPNPFF
jgi:hypothetical protein